MVVRQEEVVGGGGAPQEEVLYVPSEDYFWPSVEKRETSELKSQDSAYSYIYSVELMQGNSY
jgi:hypothetical protein